MPRAGTVVWHGDAVQKKLDDQIAYGMDNAGVFIVRKVVESFGSPPAVPEGGAKTPVKGLKMTDKRWRQTHHSKPGEPPFIQTGNLMRSITYEVKRDAHGLLLKVGSTMQPQNSDYSYAWYLEWGTPRGQMKPRPYLRPAVRENKDAIQELIWRNGRPKSQTMSPFHSPTIVVRGRTKLIKNGVVSGLGGIIRDMKSD